MSENDSLKPNPEKDYTIKDVEHDLKLIAKSIKTLASRAETTEKRVEQLENSTNRTNNNEDEDSSAEDKRKALSVLSEYVFNPEDKRMLPQMTNTPKRAAMALIIEHTINEFISEQVFNPDSDVLLSDIFMKWFARIMRSIDGNLITQAMGFSQIEMMKAGEEEERALELPE